MLVFTTIPRQASAYPIPDYYSEVDYLDSVARDAAHEYAVAQARVRAIGRQRERARQAESFFHSHGGPFAPAQSFPCGPFNRASAYSTERLAYSHISREAELLNGILARQREVQRAQAIAEAAARQEAQRRARARQNQEASLLALLGLGLSVAPEVPVPITSQARGQERMNRVPRQSVPITGHAPAPPIVDRKGKGKAIDVPAAYPTPGSPAIPSYAPTKLPTFKEELEARIRSETDPDVQESLLVLYSDLFDAQQPSRGRTPPEFVTGPSVPKHVHFNVPVTTPAPIPATPVTQPRPTEPAPKPAAAPTASPTEPETQASAAKEGTELHRTPALPPAIAAKLLHFYRARRARRLSLTEIKTVEDALRKLEDAFELPEHLDFNFASPVPESPISEDGLEQKLAYTPNNTPVHAYEHALNDLLTRLDAVESNGDDEVRGRRREVVKEVERALEAMERNVEASRERERERSKERLHVSESSAPAEADIAPATVDCAEEAPVAESSTPTTVSESVLVEGPSVLEPTAPTSTSNPTSSAAVSAPATVAPVDATTVDLSPAVDEPSYLLGSDPSSPILSPVTTDNINDTSELTADAVSSCDSLADSSLPETDPASPPGLPGDGCGDVAGSVLDVDSDVDLIGEESADPSPSGFLVDSNAVLDGAQGTTWDDCTIASSLPSGASAPESSASDEQVLDSPVVVPAPGDSHPLTPIRSTSPLPSPAPETQIQALEAISRTASAATDATFLTADAELPPLSASDDTEFFTADSTPAPSALAITRNASTASTSGGEDTFLLFSTPLADDAPKDMRAGEEFEELDITKDDFDAAKNESDWSDLGSE
ncbi:hypothetical protein C8Q74DRAFT_271226 [Fomes fomentarius]|nr:hypothetical protein C8Q74DRAFT_271226 [Fomes fomentarius]